MRKFAVFLVVVLLVIAAMTYGVWRADHDPVISTPGPLELGKQKLHQQLEDAKRAETQSEKEHWNSIPALVTLEKFHQHRIEQLAWNSQATEILAYDRDAVARLQKRIAELETQAAAAPGPPDQIADPDSGEQTSPR